MTRFDDLTPEKGKGNIFRFDLSKCFFFCSKNIYEESVFCDTQKKFFFCIKGFENSRDLEVYV